MSLVSRFMFTGVSAMFISPSRKGVVFSARLLGVSKTPSFIAAVILGYMPLMA